MFMKTNKKAFTLVELIVVITILAILGTVAFISLQEYTTMARNSVRIDGISKISSAIEIRRQSGINILSFVNTWNEVPSAEIGWEPVSVWNDYKAWELNTSAIELKKSDFIDPSNGQPFLVGATSKKWGQFEVVATIEDSGVDSSKVKWKYEQRTVSAINWTWSNWSNTFEINNQSEINTFYKWDVISGSWVPTNTKIIKVSNDGVTLTVNNNFTSNVTSIALWSEEVVWLIVWTDWITPVTENSATVAYEVLN